MNYLFLFKTVLILAVLSLSISGCSIFGGKKYELNELIKQNKVIESAYLFTTSKKELDKKDLASFHVKITSMFSEETKVHLGNISPYETKTNDSLIMLMNAADRYLKSSSKFVGEFEISLTDLKEKIDIITLKIKKEIKNSALNYIFDGERVSIGGVSNYSYSSRQKSWFSSIASNATKEICIKSQMDGFTLNAAIRCTNRGFNIRTYTPNNTMFKNRASILITMKNIINKSRVLGINIHKNSIKDILTLYGYKYVYAGVDFDWVELNSKGLYDSNTIYIRVFVKEPKINSVNNVVESIYQSDKYEEQNPEYWDAEIKYERAFKKQKKCIYKYKEDMRHNVKTNIKYPCYRKDQKLSDAKFKLDYTPRTFTRYKYKDYFYNLTQTTVMKEFVVRIEALSNTKESEGFEISLTDKRDFSFVDGVHSNDKNVRANQYNSAYDIDAYINKRPTVGEHYIFNNIANMEIIKF